MGGPGSGRKVSADRKWVVENSFAIDLRSMMLEGLLDSYHSQGKIQWRSNAIIEFDLIKKQNSVYNLTLRYSRQLNGIEHKIDYSIIIQPIYSRYVISGYFFKCPLFPNGVNCTRKAAKLYLPMGQKYFGCRHCYDLTYRTSQENHRCDSRVIKSEAEAQRMDMTGHLRRSSIVIINNRY